ncbi:hypothetical protein CIY_19430 [Butyrivibrio fibrisolvens 16/4]|nr:hypothetical protein CIY_19430 [Butyrivibrio fibrisolvens 16/4]
MRTEELKENLTSVEKELLMPVQELVEREKRLPLLLLVKQSQLKIYRLFMIAESEALEKTRFRNLRERFQKCQRILIGI